jgi:hypothetical protein
MFRRLDDLVAISDILLKIHVYYGEKGGRLMTQEPLTRSIEEAKVIRLSAEDQRALAEAIVTRPNRRRHSAAPFGGTMN